MMRFIKAEQIKARNILRAIGMDVLISADSYRGVTVNIGAHPIRPLSIQKIRHKARNPLVPYKDARCEDQRSKFQPPDYFEPQNGLPCTGSRYKVQFFVGQMALHFPQKLRLVDAPWVRKPHLGKISCVCHEIWRFI